MSVWKRLTNVARGKVKVWQNDARHDDADVERELSELERHPAPGEDRDVGGSEAQRRQPRRSDDRPAAPSPNVPDPAEEPVPRTDLFPSESTDNADEPTESPTNGGRRRL